MNDDAIKETVLVNLLLSHKSQTYERAMNRTKNNFSLNPISSVFLHEVRLYLDHKSSPNEAEDACKAELGLDVGSSTLCRGAGARGASA